MTAYLLAPVFAFVAAVFFFVPSEVMILVLANMDKVPLEVFGRSVDVSKYGTDFPWLLPFAAAAGSVAGSCIYYAMGAGALRVSDGVKKKMESFDLDRLGGGRDAVVFTAGMISVPPVSATSVASGMIKFDFRRFLLMSFLGKVCRYYIVIILGHFAIGTMLRYFT